MNWIDLHPNLQLLLVSLRGPARRRTLLFYATWLLVAALVASLEMRRDPITGWEHTLQALLGLMVPLLALRTALALFLSLASPAQPTALAARHGANRRNGMMLATAWATGESLILTSLGVSLTWAICRSAREPFLSKDLLQCCGIGCLATAAYIAFTLAATRVGLGRAGAWIAVALNLTLGHVDAGWAFAFPHRHVVNLIGYPGIFALTPHASSWILFCVVLVGWTYTAIKTPR